MAKKLFEGFRRARTADIQVGPASLELSAPHDSLLIFVDETGVQKLPDDQPYFGFGACAIPAKLHAQFVDKPFIEMFVKACQVEPTWKDRSTPIHAVEDNKTIRGNPRLLKLIANLFATGHFSRLASCAWYGTQLDEETNKSVAAALKRQVSVDDAMVLAPLEAIRCFAYRTATWWKKMHGVKTNALYFVVESSSRDALIEAALPELRDPGMKFVGREITVRCRPKHLDQSALQIADLIANTMHGQVRDLDEKGELNAVTDGWDLDRRDFKVVFPDRKDFCWDDWVVVDKGVARHSDKFPGL